MTYKISPDRRRLIITVDDAERQEIRELESPDSDAAMVDFFERLTCNSELDWITPVEARENFGDLTDAPMLGLREAMGEPTERWAFMGYETQSVLSVLAATGSILFTN